MSNVAMQDIPILSWAKTGLNQFDLLTEEHCQDGMKQVMDEFAKVDLVSSIARIEGNAALLKSLYHIGVTPAAAICIRIMAEVLSERGLNKHKIHAFVEKRTRLETNSAPPVS